MEQRCGPFIFFSNFDSGNLARVEKIDVFNPAATGAVAVDSDGEKEDCATGQPEIKPDHAFNVWISPDCAGTPYQNGNRSWFYFGVRGSLSSHTIRITVMNMNRQSKLYSQGYNVIAKFLPSRSGWERLRIKPNYRFNESSFMLTFTCTCPHYCDTAYFAFCYPWSYDDVQQQMSQLDSQFSYCFKPQSMETVCQDSIYYYRETLCYTLQGRKVDLITVSDCSNMLPEPEPRFDSRLFPEKKERCRSFKNKRVFVLTSRVHPGETPGSFVFNGFLNFILRTGDFRGKRLRQLYIFKLIPLLNPDGVYCGHYRTDTRGVNLNRVYLDPNFDLFPSIYAVKALIVFHHVNNRVRPPSLESAPSSAESPRAVTPEIEPPKTTQAQQPPPEPSPRPSQNPVSPSPTEAVLVPIEDLKVEAVVKEILAESRVFDQEFVKTERTNSDLRKSSSAPSVRPASVKDQKLRRSGTTASNLSTEEKNAKREGKVNFEVGNEGSDEEDIDFTPAVGVAEVLKYAPHLCDKSLLDIPSSMSGVAFYVDLHGHASKRGCFMYGNHLEDEQLQVDNITYAKLISLNSQHFDFEGCNFTEKNMYTKDRHDNSSKEGSGRVALYKAIGLVHSYTLECNYNMGRTTNVLSACVGPGSGRTTPPPPPSYMPTRYAPAQLEEVGRGVAIAALDMFQENPCSRLPNTEFNNLIRLKEWIRYRVLAGRADARVYRSSLNGGPLFTPNKNGGSNFSSSQAGPKHRSLSMPAAPAVRTTTNGNCSKTPKPVLLPNKSPNNQGQPGQKQITQTTPIKQPVSPTKRTLSFSTKTSSPYFSKPVIGVANLTVITAFSGSDEANGAQNGAEPASKWPSLCPENGNGNVEKRPQSPSVVAIPIRQPQQLLSVSKVEPTLTLPTPNSAPWTAVVNGQPKSSQSTRNGNGNCKTEGNLEQNDRKSGSRTSAGVTSVSAISKSFAATQSNVVVQRQMSADAVSLQSRHNHQPQSPAAPATATFYSKQSETAGVDVFEVHDSADAITEMFESSTLEISFPDYPSSAMMLDDHLETSNIIGNNNPSGGMFPPLVHDAPAPPSTRLPICSINVIMPFSNPSNNNNNNNQNGNNSNSNSNNLIIRNNHRNRNGAFAMQRATIVHPRHHLHLRQTQSPPRRKK